MGALEAFHSLQIPLPNQSTSSILEKVFSEDLKVSVLAKMTLDYLFDSEELEIIKEIKSIVEDDEQ